MPLGLRARADVSIADTLGAMGTTKTPASSAESTLLVNESRWTGRPLNRVKPSDPNYNFSVTWTMDMKGKLMNAVTAVFAVGSNGDGGKAPDVAKTDRAGLRAMQITEKLVADVLANTEATCVVVMVGMPDGDQHSAYFAKCAGPCLLVRGLLETGADAIRESLIYSKVP